MSTCLLREESIQLNEAFKQEQRQHAAAVEECCGENKVLQSSVDQLRLELAELKATVQEGRSGVTQGSSASSGGFCSCPLHH